MGPSEKVLCEGVVTQGNWSKMVCHVSWGKFPKTKRKGINANPALMFARCQPRALRALACHFALR